MVSLKSLRQGGFWLCVAKCQGVSTAGFHKSRALLLSLCLYGISAVKVTFPSPSEHPSSCLRARRGHCLWGQPSSEGVCLYVKLPVVKNTKPQQLSLVPLTPCKRQSGQRWLAVRKSRLLGWQSEHQASVSLASSPNRATLGSSTDF